MLRACYLMPGELTQRAMALCLLYQQRKLFEVQESLQRSVYAVSPCTLLQIARADLLFRRSSNANMPVAACADVPLHNPATHILALSYFPTLLTRGDAMRCRSNFAAARALLASTHQILLDALISPSQHLSKQLAQLEGEVDLLEAKHWVSIFLFLPLSPLTSFQMCTAFLGLLRAMWPRCRWLPAKDARVAG